MKSKLLSLARIVFTVLPLSIAHFLHAQNSVGIGVEDPNPNAVLDLVSPDHNQGLLVPRVTSAQRSAASFVGNLSGADKGLFVFDTDINSLFFWTGSVWARVDAPEVLQDLELTGTSLRITNNPSATVISLAPFLGTNTDEQTLAFVGNSLSISNGNSVDLSSLQDGFEANTDNQTLNLSGTNLSIAGGNSVNLGTIDTDNQTLNLTGSLLSITSGNSIDISSVDTNTQLTEAEVDGFVSNNGFITAEVDGSITNEIQNISTSGAAGNISISSGATISLNVNDADSNPANEIQDLNLSGNILTITNNAAATPIDLSPFSGTNTDNQTISLAGTNLSITGGNTIDISSIDTDTDTDDQTLTLAGNTLSIADGNSVNLSSVNTDNQALGLVGSTLSISGGNNVNLSTIDTDNQTLSLAGGSLTIAGGNTIDISSIDTNTQLDEAAVDAFVANNGYLTSEVDGSVTNEIQDLNLAGNILTITNNGSATPIDLSPFSGTNTDNQTISLAGTNLSITGGNTIDISSVDTDTQLDEAAVDAFVANNGYLTSEVDGSVTNEIQNISTNGTAGNISISSGATLSLNVNDADASATNEIQDLTFTSGIIALSNDPGSTTIDLSGYDTNVADDFNGDFSTLTNVPAGLADGDDVGLTTVSSNATLLGNGNAVPLGVNAGTAANQIVQLNAIGQLPAVDGSLLTNLPGITSVNSNSTLTGDGNATPLGVNVGTSANQIVQLNAAGQLPAVSGALLTGLPTSPWTGSPNISYNGGNVGVGTNNPFNIMAVSGTFNTASASDGIFLDVQNISGTIGALTGIRFKKNGVTANQRYNSGIFYNGDDLMLAVKTNGTATNISMNDAALTLNNQGEVGIGTTNPQQRLHVAGAVADVSGVDGAFIDIQNSNDSPASLSGVRFKNNTSIGANAYKAGILFQRGGLDANSGGSGNLIFAVNNEDNQNNFSAANERMSIGAAGVGVTGNVSVSGFFSVNQNSTLTGDVSVGGRLSVSDELRAGASGAGISGYLLRSNGSSAAPTWTPSIWDVTFGSVDNIYYSSSIGAARLGLGTSTPSTFLDIEHGNSLTPGLEINATSTFNEESSIRMITPDNTFTLGVNDVGTFVVRDGTNLNTSGSERLTITNTGVTRIVGNVGVGPAAPVPNVAMDVAGSIEYTGTITDVSDLRLKKNIFPLSNTLQQVMKVEGVSFEMKDEALGRGKEFGVIAQELEKIFPELVFQDEEGFRSVNYIGLIAPMIEAMKEQQRLIKAQSERINELLSKTTSHKEAQVRLEGIVEKQQKEMDNLLYEVNVIKQMLHVEANSRDEK